MRCIVEVIYSHSLCVCMRDMASLNRSISRMYRRFTSQRNIFTVYNNYCMANNRWGILLSALNCIALRTPPTQPSSFLFAIFSRCSCCSSSFVSLSFYVFKKLFVSFESRRFFLFVAIARGVDRTRLALT